MLTDEADHMEKGVVSRKNSNSSNSSDSSSDSGSENNVEDPWAIVELVDDSQKWAGKLIIPVKSDYRLLTTRSISIYRHDHQCKSSSSVH